MKPVVVIKLGGHALDAASGFDVVLDALAGDVAELAREGHDVVVVHGGGPQISELLGSLQIPATFQDGIRVTSAEAMAVVAMVLGLVNVRVVSSLNTRGVAASGLSGVDRSMMRASALDERYGLVASALSVSPGPLRELFAQGVVPVLSPVSLGPDGSLVNVNADYAAGAVARALGAEVLVLLSDVDQLRSDPDDVSSTLASVTAAQVRSLMACGSVRDGMRPKMTAALNALDAGAVRVVLANGSRARATIDALHGRGVFTEVTA